MHSQKTRKFHTISVILIMAFVLVAGCGGEASGVDNSAGAGTEAESAQASDAGRMFEESVKEDKCSLLTPPQVASAVSLPDSAVSQDSGLCLYQWDGGNIYLSSVRVHDSIERAKKYYARNTEDFTAEDMHAAKEKLKKEVQESDSRSGISETLIDAAPEGAVTHQRWDDIGNEAAWDGNTTMIRYGNVTVKFSGKTYDRAEGEDWVPPEIARAVAEAIVANLDKA